MVKSLSFSKYTYQKYKLFIHTYLEKEINIKIYKKDEYMYFFFNWSTYTIKTKKKSITINYFSWGIIIINFSKSLANPNTIDILQMNCITFIIKQYKPNLNSDVLAYCSIYKLKNDSAKALLILLIL